MRKTIPIRHTLIAEVSVRGEAPNCCTPGFPLGWRIQGTGVSPAPTTSFQRALAALEFQIPFGAQKPSKKFPCVAAPWRVHLLLPSQVPPSESCPLRSLPSRDRPVFSPRPRDVYDPRFCVATLSASSNPIKAPLPSNSIPSLLSRFRPCFLCHIWRGRGPNLVRRRHDALSLSHTRSSPRTLFRPFPTVIVCPGKPLSYTDTRFEYAQEQPHPAPPENPKLSPPRTPSTGSNPHIRRPCSADSSLSIIRQGPLPMPLGGV